MTIKRMALITFRFFVAIMVMILVMLAMIWLNGLLMFLIGFTI